ncbi:[acyl-carrier-protein] S-malonyltransferase [Herbaspirillum sp. SJZ130]|nr:[acyl-carrier-protein] S-malonyltransferase [Herbaspirillum sp. SJZ102]TQK03812.1 [acyl-carrier-protein] S-malonyltransferase [Herbaspirillum sp. SJZ130]TQK08544.1 [acyl-carrier-protein] S-malonyltransferase [Herbaspirillum sp. SJZ106]
MRLAILCPGQGGQHPAMFDMARADANGAAFLAQCGLQQWLDAPLADVLADPQQLYANRHAQPLIVAAQLAAWHAIADELAAIAGAPAVVAGYSVGELSAYAVAGVFGAQEAVGIAARRAGLMDAARQQAPAMQREQGLISVSGMAAAAARAVLQRHGAYVAIDTGEESLIAGGASRDLRAAADELAAMGARTGELPVGLASHTPLMQAAAAPFSDVLAQASCAAPALTLLAGITGQAVDDAAQARTLLARQLTETIQWAACMDACAERGVTVALELGSCAALSRMLRGRHPQIECRSLSDFRSFSGALAWLRRQAD